MDLRAEWLESDRPGSFASGAQGDGWTRFRLPMVTTPPVDRTGPPGAIEACWAGGTDGATRFVNGGMTLFRRFEENG